MVRRRLLPRATTFGTAAAVLGVAGLALRVLTMVGYWPGNISHPDTASYVDAAAHSLFSNPFRPAGYSVFLRLLHDVTSALWFTVAVQHLIGLGTAVLAYRVGRRAGARRGVALVPAAAVLLSGDQLYLEYSVLSDVLFLVLILAACYVALSPSAEPACRGTLAAVMAAAAFVAVSATVRTVGVALVPVLVLWLRGHTGEARSGRMRRAAAATVISMVLLGGYAAAQQQATGVFGLSRFGAWPLYARVAPIADCHRFRPPPKSERLCESVPVGQRPGPDFYLWNPDSPALRFIGFPPSGGAVVGAFARATLVHEPLKYLVTVTRDLARYVDPSLVTGPQWGSDPSGLALNQPWDSPAAWGLRRVSRYYGGVRMRVRPRLMDALETWRGVFRIHGGLIALSALLSVVALLLAPDRRTHRALVLLVAFAAVLFVVPTATASYEARYGVPASVLLLIAGARGAELAIDRLRAVDWSRLRWPASRVAVDVLTGAEARRPST